MPTFLQQLSQTLRTDWQSDSVRGRLVRSAAGTAALKIGATLMAFLASLIYARALGPHNYGMYVYVLAWTSIAAIPAGLGLSQYLVREGARAPTTISWLLAWAQRRILAAGFVAALLLTCGYFAPQAANASLLFLIAAPIPLLWNLGAIRQALLQAQGWIVRSQWASLLAGPTFSLLAVTLIWLTCGQISAINLMTITMATAIIALAINASQLHTKTIAQSGQPEKNTQAQLSVALSFMWVDGLYLINSRIDLILLGSIDSAYNAGIYAVAMRAGEFVPFLLTVANTTIGPKISQLYSDSDYKTMQRLVAGTARRVLAMTGMLGLALIIFAKQLLELFYGAEYSGGVTAMQILVLAQVLSLFGGPVGILLNMTNHADLSAKTFGFCAALNFLLNLLFIPLWGMTGAAAATGISIVTCSVIRWTLVRRHLGIRSSVFGL